MGPETQHEQHQSFILSHSSPELVRLMRFRGPFVTFCDHEHWFFFEFLKILKFECCHARVFMTPQIRFFYKIWCFTWLRKFEMLAREVVSEHPGVFFHPCRGPFAARSRLPRMMRSLTEDRYEGVCQLKWVLTICYRRSGVNFQMKRPGQKRSISTAIVFILSYSDPELAVGWFGCGRHLWIFVMMNIWMFFLKFWKKLKVERCHERAVMTPQIRHSENPKFWPEKLLPSF